MPCHQELNKTRKRKRNFQCAPDCKRQRLSDQPYEEDFWDSLSKIWLTKYALRELDRRTELECEQPREVTRARTRAFSKALKEKQQANEFANDFLRYCSHQTLQEIKSSARHGGPDLAEVRGYPELEPAQLHAPEHSMSSSYSSGRSRSRKHASASSSKTKPSINTTVTKRSDRSLPGDPNYHQKLVDGGVYPYGYRYPDGRRVALPPGWDDLNRRLAQPRPSLSPSRFNDEDYQDFVNEDASARNEPEVQKYVLPALMKAMRATDTAVPEQIYSNMDLMVAGIGQPKPDYYYGTRQELVHPEVREKLSRHILPSVDSPAVPNFTLEAKGPTRSGAEALRQACNYGAIGARAVQSLQTYGEDDPVYDIHIRSISSTYHLGTLKMYGHSVAQPGGPGTRPEYYMHQIKTWGMTSDKETFLKGATAYKNAKDLTAEYRTAAIEHANTVASRPSAAEEEAAEQEDEDISDVDGEDEASVIYASFIANSQSTLSRYTEGKVNQDEDGSETSVEAEYSGPPAKRSSRKSQRSSRSHKSHKSSGTSASKGKQRKSWFGW